MQMGYRHRKSKFTAELCLEKVIFGRSDNKLVFGEGKSKVIFEGTCQKISLCTGKFTVGMFCTFLSRRLGKRSLLNCPVHWLSHDVTSPRTQKF